jgi:hypothetical protein
MKYHHTLVPNKRKVGSAGRLHSAQLGSAWKKQNLPPIKKKASDFGSLPKVTSANFPSGKSDANAEETDLQKMCTLLHLGHAIPRAKGTEYISYELSIFEQSQSCPSVL